MVEAYILATLVSSGVSSVTTVSFLVGYKIKEGWKRHKETYHSNNLARRIHMARESAKDLEELGYSEAARAITRTTEANESLYAQRQEEWNALSLRHKLQQAIALGFS